MSAKDLPAHLYTITETMYSKWTPVDGQRHCAKHVEFHDKNKFAKLVHLVGLIIKNFFTMHGHMNLKQKV